MDGLISSVVVGIITGIASAWLSLVVFRTQRRWERKEDAYREVLEALHAMNASNDVFLNAEMEQRELSEDKIAKLRSAWEGGKAIIYKYADLGAVAISPHVEHVLDQLKVELEKARNCNTYFEALDSEGYGVRVALDAIKASALAERRMSFAWFRKRRGR